MHTPVLAAVTLVVSAMGLHVKWAAAQEYPHKPIRIVTAGVGGGTDFVARLIAQGIMQPLGQPIVVDNRGGVVPGEAVARAQPDGYTLLVQGVTHWMAPLLQATPYDPVRDFSPVTIAERSPSIIVIHPSIAANSVKELIAIAKSRPGQLNFGSVGGPGNVAQLAAELFNAMAGVNLIHVPYKATPALITDLLAGQVHLRFGSGSSVEPHVKSGKLRALAVATLQPSALYPALPTAHASGLPGYEAVSVTAVFAPARTPAAVINRLNQEMVRHLTRNDIREKFLATGAEVVASSPEQLGALVQSDMAKFGKVIKDAGIKGD
jgi:tripartite-type tricarboxylate transporter receptor subunit TctC